MVGLGLIVVLAASFRLGWAGVSSFGFDEARVSDMALQMARDNQFAELGMQSSAGVPNFPAAVWLYALPYAISTNPQWAIWLTGLVNTLAVVGVWWLGRNAWGAWAGLSAALLFASSPYLIFYSRTVWSQNWLAPLAVLWGVTAVLAINHDHRFSLGLHAFLAGFIGQVHIAGFALILGSLWLGVRYRLWRRWLPIVIGGGLALLAALPTIYTILRYGDGAKVVIGELLAKPSITSAASFRQLGLLALSIDWEKFWLGYQWVWPPSLAVGLGAASIMTGLVLVGGLLAVLVSAVRRKQSANTRTGLSRRHSLPGLLLVWGLAAPLLFWRSKTETNIQYQLVSLPALFLLAGAFVSWRSEKWWRWGGTAVLIFIALVQSTAVAQTLNRVAREFVPGGMGTPLTVVQTAVSQLRDGRSIVVETFGNIPEFDGDAAAFKVLLWDYPRQIVDARSALIIPAEPAHLFFTYDYLPAWEVAQTIGLTGTVQEFPRREGELSYWALTVDAAQFTSFTPVDSIQLANGAALQGWQVQEIEEGVKLRLITRWQFTQKPQSGHFQQFNHLYIAGEDGPHLITDVYTSSSAWQEGDTLITWADFDRPDAAISHFDIGMYTWPDLQRSLVLEADDPQAPIRLMMEAVDGSN